eukprot:EG_transcript_28830
MDADDGSMEERRARLRAKLLFNTVTYLRRLLLALRWQARQEGDVPEATSLERCALQRHWAALHLPPEVHPGRAMQPSVPEPEDAWDGVLPLAGPEPGEVGPHLEGGPALARWARCRVLRAAALAALRLLYLLGQHVDLTKVDILRMDLFSIISQFRAQLSTWQAAAASLALDVGPVLEYLEVLDFTLYD